MKRIVGTLLVIFVAVILLSLLQVSADKPCREGWSLFHKTEPPDHKCTEQCFNSNPQGWTLGSCPVAVAATNTPIPVAGITKTAAPTATNTARPTNTAVPTSTAVPTIAPTNTPGRFRPTATATSSLTTTIATLQATEGDVCEYNVGCEPCCPLDPSEVELNEALAGEARARTSLWQVIADTIKESGVIPPFLLDPGD